MQEDIAKPIEDYIRENPLLTFSLYTPVQIKILIGMGEEIECLLDKDEFLKSYGLFWLWLLGAFEVVRTMHAAKSRFSPNAWNAITKSKGRLARLRAPMAKQKLTNGKEIYAELSVSRSNADPKDYCFIVEGKQGILGQA